jgi:hypothetical protein
VGSSARTIAGRPTMARAMATRWRLGAPDPALHRHVHSVRRHRRRRVLHPRGEPARGGHQLPNDRDGKPAAVSGHLPAGHRHHQRGAAIQVRQGFPGGCGRRCARPARRDPGPPAAVLDAHAHRGDRPRRRRRLDRRRPGAAPRAPDHRGRPQRLAAQPLGARRARRAAGRAARPRRHLRRHARPARGRVPEPETVHRQRQPRTAHPADRHAHRGRRRTRQTRRHDRRAPGHGAGGRRGAGRPAHRCAANVGAQ